MIDGGNFNASDAVIALGVGKNMVSSIRYWLKVFVFPIRISQAE